MLLRYNPLRETNSGLERKTEREEKQKTLSYIILPDISARRERERRESNETEREQTDSRTDWSYHLTDVKPRSALHSHTHDTHTTPQRRNCVRRVMVV